MKRLLILTLVLVLGASSAFAQAGAINLFATPGGVSCDLADVASGLLSFYAVHVLTAGATAAQFSAPIPACMSAGAAIWLSDTAVYPVTVGNSQIGVAVGYGLCVPGPNHILTINFFAQGLTAPCCVYPVLPDPNVPSGQIEVVDCGSNLLFSPSLANAVVNPDGSCLCFAPLATEDATWGQIKAIYGE